MAKKIKAQDAEEKTGADFPGLTDYPASQDIYNKGEKTGDIEGDDNPKLKAKGKTRETVVGDDLDIPGTELDDNDELIGEEDEENNYYSLGGDDHENLEEDKGE